MISNNFVKALAVCIMQFSIVSQLFAQNEDDTRGPRGFIRLMNAVGSGTGKLDVLIDGAKIREQGYNFGDVTGGIARKPKTYTVLFQREGVVSGETKVSIEKDQTVTLIPFSEMVPATPEKEAFWKIMILKLTQLDENQKLTATVVNVTRESELKVEIRQKDETWEMLTVKRLGLTRTRIQQRSGYVPIKCQGRELKPLSVGTSGNFVAIIYEDAEGVMRSKNFQDYKYLSAE